MTPHVVIPLLPSFYKKGNSSTWRLGNLLNGQYMVSQKL